MAPKSQADHALRPLAAAYIATLLAAALAVALLPGFDEAFRASRIDTPAGDAGDLGAHRFEWILTGITGLGLLGVGAALYRPATRRIRRELVRLESEVQALTQGERALRRSESRFRDIAESLPDWIWEVDTEGRYTYCSDRAQEIVGYAPDELVGRTFYDLILPENVDRARAAFEKCVLECRPIKDLVNWCRRKDGGTVCLLTNGIPLLGRNGEAVGFRGVDRDVTDRRRAEDALRRSEEKFRLMYEESPLGLVLSDLHGGYLEANPAYLRTIGYTAEDLSRLTFWDITPPEYHSREGDNQLILRYTGRYGPYEKEYTRKDGSRVPVLLNGALIESPEGPRIWSIVEDITRRKRAESELARVQRAEADLRSRIQEHLLIGRTPECLPGAAAAALSVPSEQLDGDFYDVCPLQPDCFDVIVGDVMGKGATAALVSAATKNALLRTLTQLVAASACGSGPEQREPILPDPARVVQNTHCEVTPQLIEVERFVTLMYARFRFAPHPIVTYVNAGHARPLHLRRSTGVCTFLEGGNVPLGFTEHERYEQQHAPFEPGDLFLFYSDGVTEARNPSGVFFGEDRLRAYVEANHWRTPRGILEDLRREVARFIGGEGFLDDLTCVAIETDGPQRPRTVELAAVNSELARVREFANRLCDDAHTDSRTRDRVVLALHECASNVIRHGYNGQADGAFTLEGRVQLNRIAVRLTHRGVAYAPAAAHTPALDSTREGGFGLYIIDQTTDEVWYAPGRNGEQTVSLVWRLEPDEHREALRTDEAANRAMR